jgi:hypothetical protein
MSHRHGLRAKLFANEVALQDTNVQLKAANGTPISVIGATKVCFKANNVELNEDFLITEELDEILLGFHWLKRNCCQWLFDKSVLVINGTHIPLQQRPYRSMVRRVFVRETVSIPVNTQVNVSVRMPLVNWRSPNCD